jgi:hypothetical protein
VNSYGPDEQELVPTDPLFLLEFFLQLFFQFGDARLGESETIFVIS